MKDIQKELLRASEVRSEEKVLNRQLHHSCVSSHLHHLHFPQYTGFNHSAPYLIAEGSGGAGSSRGALMIFQLELKPLNYTKWSAFQNRILMSKILAAETEHIGGPLRKAIPKDAEPVLKQDRLQTSC